MSFFLTLIQIYVLFINLIHIISNKPDVGYIMESFPELVDFLKREENLY